MDVEMGPALAGLLGSPALPDSIPGIPTLPGAQPSLSGVRPPPGFTGTPRGPGNVHGGSSLGLKVGKVGSYLFGRESLGTPQGVSRDASRRSTPQITKSAGPVIATGVLSVARFVPHGNWMTHLLANRPVGGCWARRPCHSLVGPPGAT